jgi:hypothetical protein
MQRLACSGCDGRIAADRLCMGLHRAAASERSSPMPPGQTTRRHGAPNLDTGRVRLRGRAAWRGRPRASGHAPQVRQCAGGLLGVLPMSSSGADFVCHFTCNPESWLSAIGDLGAKTAKRQPSIAGSTSSSRSRSPSIALSARSKLLLAPSWTKDRASSSLPRSE